MKWLFAAGTIIVVAYLVVIGLITGSSVDKRLCEGVYIQVVDTARQKFVTAEELTHELGQLPMIARRTPVGLINTDSLGQILRRIDKIESVEVKRLTDGSIHIRIEPMRPVARIFEADKSYYINKDGKRISASARYHVDVPVVKGVFPDSTFTAASVLPLVKFISEHPRWQHLVSMIEVVSPRDVLIIPAIRGLVFNIGAPENFDDKFNRLERMLDEVLPTKGWEYYDTLSVKWNGQIVATRRQKATVDTMATIIEIPETDDINTMSVGENVAAGQALPGKKANSEKPIPAAKEHKSPQPSSTDNKEKTKI